MMKKTFLLPVMALLAAAACDDMTEPTSPDLQLDPAYASAKRGSFSIATLKQSTALLRPSSEVWPKKSGLSGTGGGPPDSMCAVWQAAPGPRR